MFISVRKEKMVEWLLWKKKVCGIIRSRNQRNAGTITEGRDEGIELLCRRHNQRRRKGAELLELALDGGGGDDGRACDDDVLRERFWSGEKGGLWRRPDERVCLCDEIVTKEFKTQRVGLRRPQPHVGDKDELEGGCRKKTKR